MPSSSQAFASWGVRYDENKALTQAVGRTSKKRMGDKMRRRRWWFWKLVDGVIVTGICALSVEYPLTQVAMAHVEPGQEVRKKAI